MTGKEETGFIRAYKEYTTGSTYPDEVIYEGRVEAMKRKFRRLDVLGGLAEFGGLMVQGYRIARTQEKERHLRK
jgi:hypothetical protein